MQRIIALILLIALLPFLVIVSAMLFILQQESPFFFQTRIGLNKEEFKLFKLKSMKNGEITFAGKIIRKTGIDELPQLINIILGDMNFVGPRPLTQTDINRLGWNEDAYKKRWDVKPGITGAAQLLNVCDKDATFQSDMMYVQQQNVRLDIKIIWRSILIPFIGKDKMKQLIHKQ